FFQAEDGIRDFHVTGVQTCALPIFYSSLATAESRSSRPLRQAPCRMSASKAPAKHSSRQALLSILLSLSAATRRNTQASARRPEIGRASCRERGQITAAGRRCIKK